MTAMTATIDTPIAIVPGIAPNLVEVRLKPGKALTVSGIAAILAARWSLGRERPSCVRFMFPEEETDFDLCMITTDHRSGRPVKEFTHAMAWVLRNVHNERFARLYFAYFPSPVPNAIFLKEAEVRAWLDKV